MNYDFYPDLHRWTFWAIQKSFSQNLTYKFLKNVFISNILNHLFYILQDPCW